MLTLGLSVMCHVLFSIWIHGYLASWDISPVPPWEFRAIDLWGMVRKLRHFFPDPFGYQGPIDIQTGCPGVSCNTLLPEAVTMFHEITGTLLWV